MLSLCRGNLYRAVPSIMRKPCAKAHIPGEARELGQLLAFTSVLDDAVTLETF